MINAEQLLSEVIRPVLLKMGGGFHSENAEQLLLGTAAQESNCGEHLVQLKEGPARGIFQMETWVAVDHCDFMRRYRPEWAVRIERASGIDPRRLDESELEFYLTANLAFAAAMARIHYYRKPDPLPDTVQGWAEYWKKHYNTEHGHGTVAQFVANLQRVTE